jgi:hypothetical protein
MTFEIFRKFKVVASATFAVGLRGNSPFRSIDFELTPFGMP